MRRLFFFSFTLLIAYQGVTQQTWTLQKAVGYAVQNNITVKQATAQAKQANITFTQAKNTLLPTLQTSFQSGYQRGLNENPTTGTLQSASFVTGNIGVQSGYTLFNWGARRKNIEAAELNYQASKVGIEKAQNDISLLVANAYLQVMLRMEQVKINDAAVKLSLAQLNNTRKLVDAGSQPELNALQSEAQLAKDSSALLTSQSLVQEGLITLKSYLNLDIAEPFIIDAPNVEDISVENLADLQPDYVYQLAVASQPFQRQLGFQIDAGKKQIAAARSAMYPTATAFVGLNSRFINAKSPFVAGLATNQPTGAFILDNGGNKTFVLSDRPVFAQRSVGLSRQLNNNFGQNVGVSLLFPIFNNGNLRAQWDRAKVDLELTRLQDEQEKLTLKSNIYTAYQQAYASQQTYQASSRTAAANKRALELSTKRFDIGLLGSLDYIITQNNYTTAQIQEVSNRYDFIFKMKVLEFYKGNGIKL